MNRPHCPNRANVMCSLSHKSCALSHSLISHALFLSSRSVTLFHSILSFVIHYSISTDGGMQKKWSRCGRRSEVDAAVHESNGVCGTRQRASVCARV